jgi:thiol-disulfide isomerase/thioredoxin
VGASREARGSALPVSRGRSGWHRFGLAAAAIVLGSATGVAGATDFRPVTIASISGQVITSTSGVFTPDHGQFAGDFSLPGLRNLGSPVVLGTYLGKPVILNFWASWCAPCRKEMPALETVARSMGGSVDFVGVDTRDDRSAALSFARQAGVTYPIGFDGQGEVAGVYGAYGLPTTLFISATGEVVGHQIGALTSGRLRELIHQAFDLSSR